MRQIDGYGSPLVRRGPSDCPRYFGDAPLVDRLLVEYA